MISAPPAYCAAEGGESRKRAEKRAAKIAWSGKKAVTSVGDVRALAHGCAA